MKKQYETVIYKLWNLETRMDTRSREQADTALHDAEKIWIRSYVGTYFR